MTEVSRLACFCTKLVVFFSIINCIAASPVPVKPVSHPSIHKQIFEDAYPASEPATPSYSTYDSWDGFMNRNLRHLQHNDRLAKKYIGESAQTWESFKNAAPRVASAAIDGELAQQHSSLQAIRGEIEQEARRILRERERQASYEQGKERATETGKECVAFEHGKERATVERHPEGHPIEQRNERVPNEQGKERAADSGAHQHHTASPYRHRYTEDGKERATIESGKERATIEDGKERAEQGKVRVEQGKERVEQGKKRAEHGKERAEHGKERAEDGKERVEESKERVEQGKERAEQGKERLEQGKERVDQGKERAVWNDHQDPANSSDYFAIKARLANEWVDRAKKAGIRGGVIPSRPQELVRAEAASRSLYEEAKVYHQHFHEQLDPAAKYSAKMQMRFAKVGEKMAQVDTPSMVHQETGDHTPVLEGHARLEQEAVDAMVHRSKKLNWINGVIAKHQN